MEKQTFLVTLVVNVIRARNLAPDQTRYNIIFHAENEDAARRDIQPLAKQFAATYDVVPVSDINDVKELPELLRRYCKERGFELAISAVASPPVPNCS